MRHKNLHRADATERRNRMTGRELSDKLNYLGMERKIRKLALEEKMETAEKIAVCQQWKFAIWFRTSMKSYIAKMKKLGWFTKII